MKTWKTILIPEDRRSLRSCFHSHHLRLTGDCMVRSAANNICVTSIVRRRTRSPESLWNDAVEDVSSRHDCVWSNLRFQDEFHLPAFTLAPSHPLLYPLRRDRHVQGAARHSSDYVIRFLRVDKKNENPDSTPNPPLGDKKKERGKVEE